jgi:hypothetical protein
MMSNTTRINNSILAELIVQEYLNRKASMVEKTVDEWLRSVYSGDKYAIVEEYAEKHKDDTSFEISSDLGEAIFAEHDRLYEAANKFQRKHINVLEGKTIVAVAQDAQNSERLFFIGAGGEILCKIYAGSLYDKDGFHFDTNDFIEHTR